MKKALQPEEERIVTPGPRALSDLEDLPTIRQIGDVIRFGDMTIQGADGVLEERGDVQLGTKLWGGGHAGWHAENWLVNAVLKLEQTQATLASAPLFFQMIVDSYASGNHTLTDELTQPPFRKKAEGKFTWHCNSHVSWNQGIIDHYPKMGDPGNVRIHHECNHRYANVDRSYVRGFPNLLHGYRSMNDLIQVQDAAILSMLDDVMGKGNPWIMNAIARELGMPLFVQGCKNANSRCGVGLVHDNGSLIVNLYLNAEVTGAYRRVRYK